MRSLRAAVWDAIGELREEQHLAVAGWRGRKREIVAHGYDMQIRRLGEHLLRHGAGMLPRELRELVERHRRDDAA